ncbi:MAG: hypothetical protein ABR540_07350, partial [Acidimicrobiales bacterium]
MSSQSLGGRRTGGAFPGTRPIRLLLSVLVAALVLPAVALSATPAAAYDVCDDDASCVHEYISEQA